jgi:hypothetical protein
MRDLDATQQTSPEPVSRMSVETTHPPNEHHNIFKQIDKQIWTRYAAFLQYHQRTNIVPKIGYVGKNLIILLEIIVKLMKLYESEVRSKV